MVLKGLEKIEYSEEDYVVTAQGSRFSQTQAGFYGGQTITLGGKTIIEGKVVIRGDLAKVKIGKQTVIRSGAVIRPPSKSTQGTLNFFPMQIGNYTFVDQNTVVEALKIGSCVYIGKNCVIGKRCILNDCCEIVDGTIIPPDTIIAPFSKYQGVPGRFVTELKENFEQEMHQRTRDHNMIFEPSK